MLFNRNDIPEVRARHLFYLYLETGLNYSFLKSAIVKKRLMQKLIYHIIRFAYNTYTFADVNYVQSDIFYACAFFISFDL